MGSSRINAVRQRLGRDWDEKEKEMNRRKSQGPRGDYTDNPLEDSDMAKRWKENEKRDRPLRELRRSDKARKQNYELNKEIYDKTQTDVSVKNPEEEYSLRRIPPERVQPYEEFTERQGYESELGENLLWEGKDPIESYGMKAPKA